MPATAPAFVCLCKCVFCCMCVFLFCGSFLSFAVSHPGQTRGGGGLLVATLNPNTQKHCSTCCVLAEQESIRSGQLPNMSHYITTTEYSIPSHPLHVK